MPPTQTLSPIASLTEDQAQRLAGHGHRVASAALVSLLLARTDLDFVLARGFSTSPVRQWTVEVRVKDEKPGDRGVFALAIGSTLDSTQVWTFPDTREAWVRALMRAAGQWDATTGRTD